MRFSPIDRITRALAITTIVGVVSILIVSTGFLNLGRTVHVLADIQGPQLAATYEMQNAVAAYATNVLAYIHRRDPQDRAHAAENEAAFAKVYADYLRLVDAGDARGPCRRLHEGYDELRSLGGQMMVNRDLQHELFEAILSKLAILDDIITRELRQDPLSARAHRQLQRLREVERRIAHLGPVSLHDRRGFIPDERGIGEHVAQRPIRTSTEARKAGSDNDAAPRAEPERLFTDLRSDVTRSIAMQADLHEDSRRFSTLRATVDGILENEIQAEALEDLRAPRVAADRSTKPLVLLATGLMSASFFAAAVVSVVRETRLRRMYAELRRQTQDRERAEEERARLQIALRRSEVLSSLGGIVAGVSHEVRNPLFGISSTVDALEARLKRDRGEEKYVRHVQVLRREVVRLSKLMHDLLEYGKPPAVELVDSSVVDTVRASIVACAAVAKSAGCTIRTVIAPDVNAWPMDRMRMEQVLRNLLENAIQHSPRGTVTLGVERQVRDGNAHLRVHVRDQGPGFDPAQLPHVFEPFFTRRSGGTGLGLSIVERIVDAHGGTVRAANCPAGGAEITIELPHIERRDERAEVGDTVMPLTVAVERS